MDQSSGPSDRATRRTAQSHEAVVVAAIDEAVSASTTGSIVYDWLNRHPLTDLDIRNVVANLLDDTAEFMAQRQGNLLFGDWMRGGWHDIGTTHVLMEVWCGQIVYCNACDLDISYQCHRSLHMPASL